MYYYIIPFLVYLLTIPFIKYTSLLITRVVALSFLIFIFRKFYRFKIKLEFTDVFVGFIIFLFWILLEDYYPIFGKSSYIPADNIILFFRVFSFVIITPIIEEFFTRNFLARILIDNKWKKIPLGNFTASSFFFTVAFFGFSHNRWLPGIISGILLNYLIYRKKNMGSVIIAHSTANLLLSFYIVYTSSWFFW